MVCYVVQTHANILEAQAAFEMTFEDSYCCGVHAMAESQSKVACSDQPTIAGVSRQLSLRLCSCRFALQPKLVGVHI